MPYAERLGTGEIKTLHQNPILGRAEEFLDDDHSDVKKYRALVRTRLASRKAAMSQDLLDILELLGVY